MERYTLGASERERLKMGSGEIQFAVHRKLRQRSEKNSAFAFALSKWTLMLWQHRLRYSTQIIM